MAAPKGILAILAGKPKGGEEDDGEPGSAKARALKELFSAAKSGDWDAAASAFEDACAAEHGAEESEEEEGEAYGEED